MPPNDNPTTPKAIAQRIRALGQRGVVEPAAIAQALGIEDEATLWHVAAESRDIGDALSFVGAMGEPPRIRGKYPGDTAACKQILALMGKGYSFSACAGKMGVAISTLHNWRDEHPAFHAASEIGQALRLAVFEDRILDNVGQSGSNLRVVAVIAPDEWQERKDATAASITIITPSGSELL